jgi:hypothetical protein
VIQRTLKSKIIKGIQIKFCEATAAPMLADGSENWALSRYERKKIATAEMSCLRPVSKGRAVAQAVGRWLPTSATRVRVRAACGVCVDKAALGQIFSEYFGFPCQSFHQFLHHHNHPGLAQ